MSDIFSLHMTATAMSIDSVISSEQDRLTTITDIRAVLIT
jgi:hypothetical protein